MVETGFRLVTMMLSSFQDAYKSTCSSDVDKLMFV